MLSWDDVQALYPNPGAARQIVAELRSGELTDRQAIEESAVRGAARAIVARGKVSRPAQAGIVEARLVASVAGNAAAALASAAKSRKKARKAIRESAPARPAQSAPPAIAAPGGQVSMDRPTVAAMRKLQGGSALSSLSSSEWGAIGPSLLGSRYGTAARH